MQRIVLIPCSIAAVCLSLMGCQANPITGRSQVIVMSDAEAAQYSKQAYTGLLSEARQSQALDVNPVTVRRIEGITKRLVEQAIRVRPETRAWEWEVHVLDDDQVNAWCMAGGKMAIYSGLLRKIQPSDDEIAQVMAHEISHAVLSHQAEKISRSKMQQMGLGIGVIAGAMAGYDMRGVAGLANSAVTVALQLPNSREAESEADRLGIELAARAGYDPRAAVTLWEKMAQIGGSKTPEWLSTHPSSETRLQSLRALAEPLMPVYEAARHADGQAATPSPATRPSLPAPAPQQQPLLQTPPIRDQPTKALVLKERAQEFNGAASPFIKRFGIPPCDSVATEARSRGIPRSAMVTDRQLSNAAWSALNATLEQAKHHGCTVRLIHPDDMPAEAKDQVKKLTGGGILSAQPFPSGGKDFFIVVKRGRQP